MKPISDSWRQHCRTMMGNTLNPTQEEIASWWFESDSRFCLILGGERAGKSWLACELALPCIDITKEGGKIVASFDYDKRIPLFANVSLLINYKGSTAEH